VYQSCPGLLRVTVQVAYRGQFSAVPIESHAAGVKMQPVEVAKVIYGVKKGKISLLLRASNSISKKILADNMERCCCTDKKCKWYIKCNESPEIFFFWGGRM
jgi:hypothetical protein